MMSPGVYTFRRPAEAQTVVDPEIFTAAGGSAEQPLTCAGKVTIVGP